MANSLFWLPKSGSDMVFIGRDPLMAVIRLYNELSTEPTIVRRTSERDEDWQGQYAVGGSHPWQWLFVTAPVNEVQQAIERIMLANIATSIFYDPEQVDGDARHIYAIVKNNINLDRWFRTEAQRTAVPDAGGDAREGGCDA